MLHENEAMYGRILMTSRAVFAERYKLNSIALKPWNADDNVQSETSPSSWTCQILIHVLLQNMNISVSYAH